MTVDATAGAENPVWVPPTWDEVVRTHADRVYRLAYRLSGNRADAEDLTQETFVRVFRSLAEYKPGTFEGWLHRITTNLFLDMVRRRQRIRFDALPEDADNRLAGADPGPEQTYDQMHLDPEVQAALDDLPPDFRVAVVLCDLEELSYEEIAATLGIKVGTVRSRIHRGRVLLRQSLAHRAPGRRPGADFEAEHGVSSLQHLSDEAVAAFADGVLCGHARTRATRHTAECAECAHAVREQRAAVLALRTAPAPELPGGLLDRLRGLPQVTPISAPPTVVFPDGSTMLSTSGLPGSVAAFVPSAPHPTRAHRFVPFTTTLAVVALAGALAAGAASVDDEDDSSVPGTVVNTVNTVQRPAGSVDDPMTPLFTSVDVFGTGGR